METPPVRYTTPMPATVTVRDPDGIEHVLGHGDLIGRIWSAALRLDDAGVSEAHAMVSLRGAHLHLLALRGLFALDGKPLKDLVLEAGQTVHLARGVALEVVAITLPDEVLVLEGPGLGAQPLVGVVSLVLRPTPRLRSGARDGAAAVFFHAGAQWWVRQDGVDQPWSPDWTLDTPSGTYRARWKATDAAGQATRMDEAVQAPLRLVDRYDTVLVQRDGATDVRLTGMSARLISELAAVGTALHWEPLARALWPDDADAHRVRRRFDAVLKRLRTKLRESGVRTDLVRSDRSGLFALDLREGDRYLDET